MDSLKVVHAVCPLDCPDSCSVHISVTQEGRATKIQGNPDHPVTRGFLCAKVAKYLDVVYSPDRLLYPMRRRPGVAKGPIAAGKQAEVFERISWDEALDTIAARLQDISNTFGPEAILPYSYAGNMAVLGYGSMDRRFFSRLGASRLDRTICATAGGEALMSVYGAKLGTDTEHFRHARTILAWGANILGNNVHLWPFIQEARQKGARLIVIDPYATRTAKASNWHLQIRPGTDSALALGMMHVLITENLYDADYVRRFTHGFEPLRTRVQEYTPACVAELTGLSTEEIVRLAREYAIATPSVIRLNYGVQRGQNGGAAVRAIAMLPCLTGAWKHLGGGLQLSTSGAFHFNRQALERPDLAEASPIGRAGRIVNMSRLGHALTELSDPAVQAMLVYNSNPAVIAPNQKAVLQGLRREDLFTVVHEQFFTDTTDYADVVLPATTFFEHKDFQGTYGHYYVQLSQPAIAPLGEARSNVTLFRQLAQRMGFTESCFRDSEEDMIDQALGGTNFPWLEGITREKLESQHSIRLKFPQEKAGGNFQPFVSEEWFRTPSGKAEFYSEMLAEQGYDPLPGYVAADESRHSALARKFPLELLPRKNDNFMNSTFAGSPAHQAMEAAHFGLLEMHPEDALARGIADGDAVDVFNERGKVRLVAKVGASVPAGVAASRLGWNKLTRDGQGVNSLTSETLTDLGGGPTFYSTLVQVRRVHPDYRGGPLPERP
ncbi:MAG TPA: molybdopterin-dependent oxidoreductase [Acidobacteriaceae bacterium]|nr:molybdopterin-dependent oxidoreductase [Acidobacteriaceae bacterium]